MMRSMRMIFNSPITMTHLAQIVIIFNKVWWEAYIAWVIMDKVNAVECCITS